MDNNLPGSGARYKEKNDKMAGMASGVGVNFISSEYRVKQLRS